MYLTTSRRACSRLGGTTDVIHDPPGHPTCPATARRVVTQASQGGARSECYTATVTTSDGARSKENSGAISECYGQEDRTSADRRQTIKETGHVSRANAYRR